MSTWNVKNVTDLEKQDIPGIIVVDDDSIEVDYINGNMQITLNGKGLHLSRDHPASLDDQIDRVIKSFLKMGKACTASVRFACREGPDGCIEELVYEGPGRMVRMVSPDKDDKLLPVFPASILEARMIFLKEK